MQFEIESIGNYYGSYTDRFLTGSILTGRGVAGYHSSASFEIFGVTSLSQFCYFTNQSNPTLKSNIRHIQLIESNKQIYDTFLPTIDEIVAIDGGKLCLTNIPNPGTQIPRFQYLFGNIENGVRYTVTASNGDQISDDIWLGAFPFEGRYRSVSRRANSYTDLTNRTYFHSVSFGSTSPPIVYTSPTAVPVYSPIVATAVPFWGNTPGSYTVGLSVQMTYVLTATGSSIQNASHSDVLFLSTEDYVGYYSASSSPPFIATESSQYPTFATRTSNANIADTIKHLYGNGDGNKNRVFHMSGNFPFVDSSNHRVGVGARIRGWKYGLYSGFPSYGVYVFRRNKFGQFRDMLEQKLYTKTIDRTTNTIDSPIFITFTSGTSDYITASNPNLNTRDSGMYNAFYSVGKPWVE